jgi:polysaccharide export outer membrane protein
VPTVFVVAIALQLSHGAESQLRMIGKPQTVESPKHQVQTGKVIDSKIRVASQTESGLRRQESKLVARGESEDSALEPKLSHAEQELVALRDGLNAPASTAPTNRQNKAAARCESTPAGTTMTLVEPQQKVAPTKSLLVASRPTVAPHKPVIVAKEPAPIALPEVPVEPPKVVIAPRPAAVATPRAVAPPPKAKAAPKLVAAESRPIVKPTTTVAQTPTTSTITPEPIVVAAKPRVDSKATLQIHAPPAAIVPPVIAAEPAHALTAANPVINAETMYATMQPNIDDSQPIVGLTSNEAVELPAEAVAEPGTREFLLPQTGDCCAYGPGQSGAQSICGVDCGGPGAPCCATWDNAHRIPWSLFGPGEYVGPARTEHVPAYYLRVNDLLTLTYITSRQKLGERYQIGVGDRLRIESSVDESLDREVQVQPDGEITLPIVGEVMAAGKTVKQLRDELTDVFRQAQRQPQITVTPLEINTGLHEIIRAVKAEIGSNGQALTLKVTPEGTIQAPGIGSVFVQGLTLEELRTELEARYAATFGAGLLISPALTERATSYVFVGGEVKNPDRYTLEGPTTVMQAIAMAGGWNIGGNVRQVVVFRRDENWCLKATLIDVRAPLYGTDPCPVNDIWLRDNDLVIVPKSKILCATDVINLYFTRGVYAVFPVTFFQDLSRGTTIIP